MSHAIGDEELDLLLDQVPAVAGRPRSYEELSGGLTNRNLKVTTPDGVFVARCSAPDDGSGLAIDREQEHLNTRAAAESGVGAPVVAYRPDAGVLVIEYIDGVTLTNEHFTAPGLLPRVARACRTLHAGPRFHGEFDMFERQRGYLDTVRRHGYRVPDGYESHAHRMDEIRAALAVRHEGTVPCNNDLLAGNFVDDGEKIWLIDYEYSGNNDPCFELGNIWSECGLSLDQLAELVTAYYGTTLRHKIARARLQGIASKYGWTLWGCIQHATSPLDFDFWGWATERYDAAVAEFDGAEFPSLLHDVTLTD